jgi:hypothetical protein
LGDKNAQSAWAKARAGQALVEFVLVLPVAILMSLGVMALLMAISARNAVQNAQTVATQTVAAGLIPTSSQIAQALEVGIGLHPQKVLVVEQSSCPPSVSTPEACVAIDARSVSLPNTGPGTSLVVTGGVTISGPDQHSPQQKSDHRALCLPGLGCFLRRHRDKAHRFHHAYPVIVFHHVTIRGPLADSEDQVTITTYYYDYRFMGPLGRVVGPLTWKLGPVTIYTARLGALSAP